ncbi:uncharacterized protein LOC123524178 isoform X2 [Mercenaria mercenaria]|uniref:uncharacterized protein LOC123524178 isoform X2 n=1 Tax=Mercenaria mercenaria TaxID=6596 RepID=UPI00234ED89D|nr:uncharacterized protein LOC123524178 isoform X2 [Mercenaria mercenaria]
MKIIPEPLKISAQSLLIAVEHSHYGVLYVYAEKRTFGNPLSGNLNLRKERIFAFVFITEMGSHQNYLHVIHLRQENDSGYGSAGTVPALREYTYETEELDVDGRKYDKVDERLFGKAFQPDKKNTQAQRNVKHELHSEDIDYEPVNFSHEHDVCKRVNDIEPANQGSSEGLGAIGNREEAPIKTKPKIYMEELKSRLKSDHRGLSSVVGKDTQAKTSLLKSASLASVASSYLSVKIGDETSDNVTPSTGQPVVQTQVGERGNFRRDSSFASSYCQSEEEMKYLTMLSFTFPVSIACQKVSNTMHKINKDSINKTEKVRQLVHRVRIQNILQISLKI